MNQKNNETIAKFIGMQKTDLGWFDAENVLTQYIYDVTSSNCHDTLHFNESWDWLIPVIEICYVINNEEHLNAFPDLCNFNIKITYEIILDFINNLQ